MGPSLFSFLCTSSLFQIASCLLFGFPALSITGRSLSFGDGIPGSPTCAGSTILTVSHLPRGTSRSHGVHGPVALLPARVPQRLRRGGCQAQLKPAGVRLSPAFQRRPAFSQVTARTVCPVTTQPSPKEPLLSGQGKKKNNLT